MTQTLKTGVHNSNLKWAKIDKRLPIQRMFFSSKQAKWMKFWALMVK